MIPTRQLRRILHMYYCGEALSFISFACKTSKTAIKETLKRLQLPKRPHGCFSGSRRDDWLKEVKGLKRLFDDHTN